MLTAKEKALELIDKFIPHTRVYNDEFGWEDDIESSIQCARIAVDEIIELYEFHAISNPDDKRVMDTLNYFDEVKQEILKYETQ
jgi:hypothetical protein